MKSIVTYVVRSCFSSWKLSLFCPSFCSAHSYVSACAHNVLYHFRLRHYYFFLFALDRFLAWKPSCGRSTNKRNVWVWHAINCSRSRFLLPLDWLRSSWSGLRKASQKSVWALRMLPTRARTRQRPTSISTTSKYSLSLHHNSIFWPHDSFQWWILKTLWQLQLPGETIQARVRAADCPWRDGDGGVRLAFKQVWCLKDLKGQRVQLPADQSATKC